MVIRTKRKLVKKPHGMASLKTVEKKAPGFRSTSTSYSSSYSRNFCENAWVDGYRFAQREFAIGTGDPAGSGRGSGSGSSGSSKGSGSGSSSSKDTKKAAESWWKSLSEGEQKWLKGTAIAAGTGITLAALYQIYRKSKESSNPTVQRSYSDSFINGYTYAQRVFGGDGLRSEFSVRRGEDDYDDRRDKKREEGYRIGKAIALGSGIAGAGTLIGTGIAEHSAKKKAWDAIEKDIKQTVDKSDRKVLERLHVADDWIKEWQKSVKDKYDMKDKKRLFEYVKKIAGKTKDDAREKFNDFRSQYRRNRWLQPLAAGVLAGAAIGGYELHKDKEDYYGNKRR
jgi:hypothetical protein